MNSLINLIQLACSGVTVMLNFMNSECDVGLVVKEGGGGERMSRWF